MAWLTTAAAAKNFRFTGYRILLALIPVLGRGRLRQRTRREVATAIDRVEANTEADPSLQQLIERLRSLLAALSPRSPV